VTVGYRDFAWSSTGVNGPTAEKLQSKLPRSGSLNSTSGLLGIGRAGSDSSRYFNGGIDEGAVYNRALSAARVQAHYKAATAAG
jgi:hypothetical protein